MAMIKPIETGNKYLPKRRFFEELQYFSAVLQIFDNKKIHVYNSKCGVASLKVIFFNFALSTSFYFKKINGILLFK